VINGQHAGPVLCLTAAIHGDELNGVEIIRQVVEGLDPLTLSGVVICIPIVNLEGYRGGERYLGDSCDLNRCFPGTAGGAYPDQIAYGLFQKIILHCDALIDLHTGSALRENHPQLRADLANDRVAALSTGFGDLSVLQSIAPPGSLRAAATVAGVPALVMEVGSTQNLETDKVLVGVQGLRDLMQDSGMTVVDHLISKEQHVYLGSGWVRSEFCGILINSVELGETVKAGDMLAEIIDPLTNRVNRVFSPFSSTILGLAHNQYVKQGFSLFRIGIE
jgi:predicted deacylase